MYIYLSKPCFTSSTFTSVRKRFKNFYQTIVNFFIRKLVCINLWTIVRQVDFTFLPWTNSKVRYDQDNALGSTYMSVGGWKAVKMKQSFGRERREGRGGAVPVRARADESEETGVVSSASKERTWGKGVYMYSSRYREKAEAWRKETGSD